MSRMILIVDDNAMNRQVLIHALSGEYETMEAVNGEDALAVIRRSYKLLSAVLLDIMMPVMDGYEVLRQLRESPLLSQIPVIVVTGSEDEETRVKALSLGANDFVTKPYNPEIIRHCLKNNIALRETASIVNAIQRDKLTGVYNRAFFFEKAEEIIKHHPAGSYIMASFDIDNFKLVNDQYGAAEGDKILRYIGQSLRKTFDRVNGLCGRISGDNFASLFPNDPETIQYVTEGHGVRYLPQDAPTKLMVSVGRYVVTDPSLPASALYDRAYIAKQSVKGRYDKHIAYFDDSMLETLVREQQIAGDVGEAMQKRQFEVWYQPQYNHATGALVGAEALVRWRHPKNGLVPPGDFIPVFEQNGFIYELDKFVWEETCRYLREWIDAGLTPPPVSVNLSRYDIFREDLTDVICALKARYRIPVDLLRLEITESAFARSAEQIIAVVRQLQEHGFTVEIDDFGSGYSSLNTLKDVPAQVLKIDMHFLSAGGNAQRGGNILESVVRMTQWLGMSIIAEGVETAAQADYLASIGCMYVQGYLYARPMPRDEYEALLRESRRGDTENMLTTVEHLNKDRFWDPASLDTLIFNSYIGGACVFEYRGRIEIVRANDKFAKSIGGERCTLDDVFRIRWEEHMDEAAIERVGKSIVRAMETGGDESCETEFKGLLGNERTFLRMTVRMIANIGERRLYYCTSENITRERLAEEKERDAKRRQTAAAEQLSAIMDDMYNAVTAAAMEPDGTTKILLSNDRYYEMLGFTRASYAEQVKSPFDLIHPEDLDTAKRMSAEVMRTKRPTKCEVRLIRADGTVRNVRLQLSQTRFIDVEPDVQLCVYADVTAEKEAERKLHDTDAQLKLLTDNIPGGLCRYAYRDGKFRMDYFSDGFCRLFGYSREEYAALAEQDAVGRVFAEERPMLDQLMEQMVKTGEPIKCTLRVHVHNGGYKWVRQRSAVSEWRDGSMLINTALFDVTEEHEAEERLRISEEGYRLATQHSRNVIGRLDIAERTLSISKPLAERFGLDETMTDMPYARLRSGVVSKESERDYREFYEEILNGGDSGKRQFQLNLNNSWRWIEAHYSAVHSNEGEPAFAVISFVDITEQREKEASYARWQQSLAEKAPDSYTLFRCNISQNAAPEAAEGRLLDVKFNQHLHTFDERTREYVDEKVYKEDRKKFLALLNCDTLLANYYRGKRSASTEFRERCADGGLRWLRLTVDLVEYPGSKDVEAYVMYEDIDEAKRAEIEALASVESDALTGVLNRTAFSKYAEESLSTVQQGAQHALMMLDIDGFKLVNDALGHSMGDQALRDVAHAIRGILRKDDLFGRFGGDEFVILLHDVPDDAAVIQKARQVGAAVRRTFSPTVQISASIGIVMCPRDGQDFETLFDLADATMYHVKNRGKDNFAFYHENMNEEPLPLEDGTDDAGLAGKPRMLIVDDSWIDYTLFESIFSDSFRIIKATDGASALTRLRHYRSSVSVVLLDLMMPGMDGFSVLESMQGSLELRTIPVVVVSAAGDHETCLKAMRAGASDFVAKPVDPDILRVRVLSAINRAENERLRAKNSVQELRTGEAARYQLALEANGILVVEYDWVNGTFIYESTMGDHIAGLYNGRRFWQILLSDMVTDTATVREMQELTHELAENRDRRDARMCVRLKKPNRALHWFDLNVYKVTNTFGLTDKMIMTFVDVGTEKPAQQPSDTPN